MFGFKLFIEFYENAYYIVALKPKVKFLVLECCFTLYIFLDHFIKIKSS